MSVFFLLLEGGNAVRFFILCLLCLVRCLLAVFAVLLFLGSLFEKLSGANFCFRCWSCVFWWVFAYVSALCFGGSLLKVYEKFS